MANRKSNKPELWKIYKAMLRKIPLDYLKGEAFYNLSWDIYRFTDYDLEFPINLMKQAIYYCKRAHSYETLIYAFDSLAEFYAMKNNNINTLE